MHVRVCRQYFYVGEVWKLCVEQNSWFWRCKISPCLFLENRKPHLWTILLATVCILWIFTRNKKHPTYIHATLSSAQELMKHLFFCAARYSWWVFSSGGWISVSHQVFFAKFPDSDLGTCKATTLLDDKIDGHISMAPLINRISIKLHQLEDLTKNWRVSW